MRMIYKIAKTELQILFYSPIAWLLLLVFAVQIGWIFTGSYEWYMKTGGYTGRASMSLFAFGIFGSVQKYLYYYIPLLTMGLVSRELSSGSIKLLYSSPVRNSQIILGKFLSMVFYSLIMCTIMILFILYATFTVKDFEGPVVWTGLLGIFLLTCTYAAIGIYISSLTAYQFVAAIGTFIVLMLLSLVGGWWQEYDFVRDVTYWFSINGRASTFINGMICSEDVIYFPVVAVLFLMLAIIRMNAIRQKLRWYDSTSKYLVVVLAVCMIGFLSSRPKLMAYYDASSTKWNTLAPLSQEIVKKLEGGLKITAYANILSSQTYNYVQFPGFIMHNREMFKMYERFKPETKLKVVYYYDTITAQDNPIVAQALADKMKAKRWSLWDAARNACETWRMDSSRLWTPEEVRQEVDLTGERTFVWRIERESGEVSWLRTYDDPMSPWPTEAEISVALKRLTMELPKIGFVMGRGMRSISDTKFYGYNYFACKKDFRNALINQGFDVVEMDLEEGIPEDVNILTIADMREPFSANEERVLADYIAKGGNLYILGEPRRRDVMNPLLSKYFGVEIMPGTLVQYRLDWLQPDIVQCFVMPEARALSFYFQLANSVRLPSAAGLQYKEDRGYRVIPVLKTDTTNIEEREARSYAVWNEMGSLDYVENRLTPDPNAGEIVRDYYTAYALTRIVNGKEQRVMIMGDADCISNSEITESRSQTNFIMDLGVYNWLSNNEMPLHIQRAMPTDNRVYITKGGYYVMNGIFMYGVPGLLAIGGLLLWLRRRGK